MTNYLGVDIGYKRIGLSVGSSDLMVALPLTALVVSTHIDPVYELAKIIQAMRIDVVVFGYPFHMNDSISPMAKYVDSFIENLKKYVPVDVSFIKSDERLTSVQAENDRLALLNDRFESAKRKRTNRRKGVVDSNAAAIILQDYLDELSCGLRKCEDKE